MVFDRYFLNIPIYRLSRESYKAKMENDFRNSFLPKCGLSHEQGHINEINRLQHFHFQAYGGCWEFNEIVGYIKLFFMGSQVRGEYWSTVPDRKVKTRKKQFVLKALKLVHESSIWEMDNDGIISAIDDYLDRSKKELKHRYLDLHEYELLKDNINWVQVYKNSNLITRKKGKT